jgi:hypothetical protein
MSLGGFMDTIDKLKRVPDSLLTVSLERFMEQWPFKPPFFAFLRITNPGEVMKRIPVMFQRLEHMVTVPREEYLLLEDTRNQAAQAGAIIMVSRNWQGRRDWDLFITEPSDGTPFTSEGLLQFASEQIHHKKPPHQGALTIRRYDESNRTDPVRAMFRQNGCTQLDDDFSKLVHTLCP